jgi:gamma-glutamyltranspeptidase / glutathione hydrolase
VGSQTIPNSVAQVLVNLVDRKLPLNQALAAPRIYHQWLPDKVDYETGALSAAAMASLKTKGHFLVERRSGTIGMAQAVMMDRNGQKLGATDSRYAEASALGY